MLDETKKFYELVKLNYEEKESSNLEPPIEFLHIFKKEYPRFKSISLPKGNSEDGLEKLLASRESVREFSNEPMSFDEISKIMNSCRIVDKGREPERRTYPSAGARFPLELYLLNYNVEGLEKGAHHYNMEKSSLETLWEKDLDSEKEKISGDNIYNQAATIVMTSVISRSEVKYGNKALPFSYLEAGHMGQNIILSATQNNIGTCPVSGFVDDSLIEILDLTDGEIPVYTINVGKKKEI